jgi:NADPH-dependent glutamate synthase beta subunit-like oxidoreductase
MRHLHATDNFPEFPGRICPAPSKAARGIDQILTGDSLLP